MGAGGPALKQSALVSFPFTLNSKLERPGNGCVFKVAKLLSLDCFPIICFALSSPMGLITEKDTMQYR